MQLQWIRFAASARAVLEICVGNWFIYQCYGDLSCVCCAQVYINIIYWHGSLGYYKWLKVSSSNRVKKTDKAWKFCETWYFLRFLKEQLKQDKALVHWRKWSAGIPLIKEKLQSVNLIWSMRLHLLPAAANQNILWKFPAEEGEIK